jgi:TM2 domain-containing membrane protein YozV
MDFNNLVNVAGALYNAFEVPPKEKGGAYARLIFLGLVGWHMFYMEKPGRGFLYILSFAAMMLGWILRIPLLGFLLTLLLDLFSTSIIPMTQYIGAGALIVFFVFDLITLGHQVDKWNATHETGNLIGNRAGKALSNVISIPLKNAANEYNGVVETYQGAIGEFNRKRKKIKKLQNELQQARDRAFGAVSKMQKILTQITVKGSDERDVLDTGNFSGNLNALMLSDSSIVQELGAVFDSSTQEMKATFSVAAQSMQTIGGKAGAVVAVAEMALAAIGEFARQQEEVVKLNQRREEVLSLQMEVETQTMKLEATEKRAAEILKVINAEVPAFNQIYNQFYDAVFPEGFTGQKDIKELTPEQRKMFSDLGSAVSNVLAVIKLKAGNHKRKR